MLRAGTVVSTLALTSSRPSSTVFFFFFCGTGLPARPPTRISLTNEIPCSSQKTDKQKNGHSLVLAHRRRSNRPTYKGRRPVPAARRRNSRVRKNQESLVPTQQGGVMANLPHGPGGGAPAGRPQKKKEQSLVPAERRRRGQTQKKKKT